MKPGPFPNRRCHSCGSIIDTDTGVGHDNPVGDGDVSICFSCGMVGIFADGGKTIRAPTPEELHDVMITEEANYAIEVVRRKNAHAIHLAALKAAGVKLD